MTAPQIIMALWMAIPPIIDMIQHGKGKCWAWWTGRVIGHTITVSLLAGILYWGGFW